MPAARPSQPAVANVVGALVSAGLRVAAVQVGADGSFSVQIADATQTALDGFAVADNVRNDEPPSWDEVDE